MVFLCNGSNRANDSSLALSLLLVAGLSVSVTVSSDEDVGEIDEVEELVNKPGTTNGAWLDVSQWNFLLFLMVPGHSYNGNYTQNSSQSFSKWKNRPCIFKKHYRHEQVQFTDVCSCLFFCLHFAVCCHFYHRIFQYPHVLQFGFVWVSLADHVHACSGIYHKLSFLGVYCGCGRQNPLLRRWIECSFVFLFELEDFPDKFQRISAGASLLWYSLSWRSVLKFHSVGTSLMRNFDLYFTKRRTFLFSDVCLTQRSSCESYSSNWFQHSSALPWNRCRIWRLSVLWYTTQLSYIFRNSNCTFAFILLRLFCLVALQPTNGQMTIQRGRMPILTRRFSASTFSRSIYTAVDWISQTGFFLWHFFFSTDYYLVFLKIVAQRVVRLCTIVILMPKTTLVSHRTLPFWLPLVTNTFSSFNST